MKALGSRGWAVFPADTRSAAWAVAARAAADRALSEPGAAHWLRCQGTWFAGVNILDTEPRGSIGHVPLAGPAIDQIRDEGTWPERWDRAQVSVIYPGYPKAREGESDAAARYRRDRDAAHVDGLLPMGAERRRMVQEFHAFILGLPLSKSDPDAAPLVVWEGSHRVVARAFRAVLEPLSPKVWCETDLTEVYHAARREVFATCRRVKVHALPGEAYLVHRLALHGISPWVEGASSEPDGRMIAYFRPAIAAEDWLWQP